MSATPPPAAAGWRGLAWRAYEHLPRAADPLIALGTRTLLPLANLRVPLTVLRGPVASGGTGAILMAGPEGGAAAYLGRRFFAAEPAREALPPIPIWKLRGELARRRPDVDLVAARLDRLTAAVVLDASYTIAPEWVGALMPVPADPWRLCRRSKSLQNNLRRAERAALRARVTHDERDFHAFYDDMYVPFVQRLHGPEAMISNRARMRRCFRQGGLLLGLRDGDPIAGCLYRTRGTTCDMVVVGTAGGAIEPWRAGTAFALELLLFEHARDIGCTMVDFGGSRASPLDGLLLYKARWGSRIVVSRTLFYELGLAWERLSPALLAFLTNTPLIFRQRDGLAALWASAGVEPDLRAAHAVLQSLRRVYLLSGDRATSPPLPDVPVVRIDPARQPQWRPPRRADGET